MRKLVIDASVAAKWSLKDENLVQEAVALLNRYAQGEILLLVPDLFWAETGNVLWNAVRRGRCTRNNAEAHMAALNELCLTTLPSQDLVESAFRIATHYNRTVYDSIYIALAVQANAEMVTADEKLANAVAAYLPAKWLGAWS